MAVIPGTICRTPVWHPMPQLIKRLEPQAGGFILRISAKEAQELGLSAGVELDVNLVPRTEPRREEMMRR